MGRLAVLQPAWRCGTGRMASSRDARGAARGRHGPVRSTRGAAGRAGARFTRAVPGRISGARPARGKGATASPENRHPAPAVRDQVTAGAGLCRLHDNSPASCTTRHRSTDRYPKQPCASVKLVLPDLQPGTGCCTAMAPPRWWERPSLPALIGGCPGQNAARLRRGSLLPAELVELSVSYPSEKCMPFVRREPENWTFGVLAVPDADLGPGQTCHLDAVTVGQAQGALSPVQT